MVNDGIDFVGKRIYITVCELEHHQLEWVKCRYIIKSTISMAIFNSYVKLSEGNHP